MKIVSTNGCINCISTKKILKRKGIPFEEVNYDELTEKERNEYKALAESYGVRTFPLIVTSDSRIITLDEAISYSELKVIKRNGLEAKFDKERIIKAINSAAEETGNVDKILAETIAENILEDLKNKTTISVEEIQDIVEAKLMDSNRKDIAKKYILYRDSKSIERTKKALVENKKSTLLTDEFINKYKHLKAPFTEFGEFVYYRTYSRWIEELQRNEYWYETVRRAVEFNCSLLKTSREEAEELYDNIFNLKQFLSGRTMWTGNTKVSKLYPLSNFNCAFIIVDNFAAYEDIFYTSMVGTGIGFRILKEDVEKLPKVRTDIRLINEQYIGLSKVERKEHTSVDFDKNTCTITVGDSKEGWTDALSFFLKMFYSSRYRIVDKVVMNYNNIRPFGERLETFGGTASGHESMRNMITKIYKIMVKDSTSKNKKLRPIDAMDIANIIAENVVSGGVRRSAQINLFGPDDKEVLEAKSKLYTQNENGEWGVDKEIEHRQMSNNSIFYNSKPTKEQIHWQIEQMRYNGEPAFINAEVIRKRRADGEGCNPCGK